MTKKINLFILGQELAKDLRLEALSVCSRHKDFRRDDYKEVVELTTLFLGGDDNTGEKAVFKKPGAVHKARWMAKILFTIKVCLFEQQICDLPRGTIITKQQLPKLYSFVCFVTLVYHVGLSARKLKMLLTMT